KRCRSRNSPMPSSAISRTRRGKRSKAAWSAASSALCWKESSRRSRPMNVLKHSRGISVQLGAPPLSRFVRQACPERSLRGGVFDFRWRLRILSSKMFLLFCRRLAAVLALFATFSTGQEPPKYQPSEGDFVAHNFKFRSGEQLPELRLHYRT